VRPTRFWNNLHQIHSKSKDWKDKHMLTIWITWRVYYKGEELPTLREQPKFTPGFLWGSYCSCFYFFVLCLFVLFCLSSSCVFCILMSSVSLHCPVLIVPSVFSNVYCHIVVLLHVLLIGVICDDDQVCNYNVVWSNI